MADAFSIGDVAGANAVKPAAPSAEQRKAREVAEEFEAVFLAEMLKEMWSGVPTDGPFGGGPGEDVYRSMLTEQYAGAVAKRGGIGLADAVYREILKLQEIGNGGE